VYLKALTAGLGFPIPDEYIWFYIRESSKNIEWFQNMGAEIWTASQCGHPPGTWIPFFPQMPGADAIASEEQYYKVGFAGKPAAGAPGGLPGSNWLFLEDQIAKRPGIRKMYETPAKRLIQDPRTKTILGVVVESEGWDKCIKARRGVCVCGGGYEYNQEMIRDFVGIPVLYSKGSPYNTGETIKMCWAAGADLVAMSAGLSAPTYLCAGIFPQYKAAITVSQTPRAGGCITIGANNKRWRDEYRVAVKGIGMKEQATQEGAAPGIGKIIENGVYVRDKFPMPMHIILDEKARLTGGPLFGGVTWMGWACTVEGYKPSADNSAELAMGWMVVANTVRELAMKIGRDPDAVEATVNRWNQFCAGGRDLDFGRVANLTPIEVPPFYAIQCFPECLNTQGGMRRNTKAQVLDIDGRPIPKLYAAGENGDIIWRWVYQCMSNVGAGCYGYGRVAGQNAAAEEPWD